MRDGVRVLLAGRPNVGKSSLFNALLGEERAIVTAVPGTTRDLVSERLDVAGIPVTLLDGAGLRASDDLVEAIGIERARAALESCPVALWVVDRSAPLQEEDRWIAARLAGRRVVVALNKSDLDPGLQPAEALGLLNGSAGAAVEVSATRGDGLDALHRALADALGAGDRDDREGRSFAEGVSNSRHVDALQRARDALRRAGAAGATGAPGEIVALELREALAAIGEVTGRTVGEDLLDRIFGRFCIGK